MWNSISTHNRKRLLPRVHCWNFLLPLQWRITHSSYWKVQVLASELSLIAFLLLLVMVLSKKWLYLSKNSFFQRWPTYVSNRIYILAYMISIELLQICKSKSR